jgi:hypothetical protein
MLIDSNISKVCEGVNTFIFPEGFSSEVFKTYLDRLDLIGKYFVMNNFGTITIGKYLPECVLEILERLDSALVVCPDDVNEIELLAYADTDLRFVIPEHKLDKLKLLGEFIC